MCGGMSCITARTTVSAPIPSTTGDAAPRRLRSGGSPNHEDLCRSAAGSRRITAAPAASRDGASERAACAAEGTGAPNAAGSAPNEASGVQPPPIYAHVARRITRLHANAIDDHTSAQRSLGRRGFES